MLDALAVETHSGFDGDAGIVVGADDARMVFMNSTTVVDGVVDHVVKEFFFFYLDHYRYLEISKLSNKKMKGKRCNVYEFVKDALLYSNMEENEDNRDNIIFLKRQISVLESKITRITKISNDTDAAGIDPRSTSSYLLKF